MTKPSPRWVTAGVPESQDAKARRRSLGVRSVCHVSEPPGLAKLQELFMN